MRAFQAARGLPVSGVCDAVTWTALVESGHRLGDRLLYHRVPMLRGDDVAELQRCLGALGFDAGRVDGILGPGTAKALMDFQANIGLRADGICGHETVALLRRLSAHVDGAAGIAQVREREALRAAPRTLSHRRVVVGDFGGLDALARATRRALDGAGADVIVLDDPDGSAQAAAANGFRADVYLGLTLGDDGCHASFYAATGFESAGGRRLAELIQEIVPVVLHQTPSAPRGMRLPVLRETRMPAVLCSLGPPTAVVPANWRLANALTEALVLWCRTPIAPSDTSV